MSGAVSSQAPVSASDAGVTSITTASGTTSLYIQNVGANKVFFGGVDVDTGDCFLVPSQGFWFNNVGGDFQVYFTCDTGKSSSIASFEG